MGTVSGLRVSLGRHVYLGKTVSRLIKKFEETDSTVDIKTSRSGSNQCLESIAVVRDNVTVSPKTSFGVFKTCGYSERFPALYSHGRYAKACL